MTTNQLDNFRAATPNFAADRLVMNKSNDNIELK